MKQVYQKPAMCVVRIQQTHIICQSVTGTDGNALMNYRGRGNGESRVKGQGDDDWYEDWEE